MVPLGTLRGLSLFSGIGAMDLGLQSFVRPVAYCEVDPAARAVLFSRMLDGRLPVAPIWDDVRRQIMWDDHDDDYFDGFADGVVWFGGLGFWATLIALAIVAGVLWYF